METVIFNKLFKNERIIPVLFIDILKKYGFTIKLIDDYKSYASLIVKRKNQLEITKYFYINKKFFLDELDINEKNYFLGYIFSIFITYYKGQKIYRHDIKNKILDLNIVSDLTTSLLITDKELNNDYYELLKKSTPLDDTLEFISKKYMIPRYNIYKKINELYNINYKEYKKI